MWQPRTRQRKGGTPSTPDIQRKKVLVRNLSLLRCITFKGELHPFSQVQLHRLSFFFTIWATIENSWIPSMRIHGKSEANFKSIRVFKYRQVCSPSFCCPNASDHRLLSSFFLWQRNDSYFHSIWIGMIKRCSFISLQNLLSSSLLQSDIVDWWQNGCSWIDSLIDSGRNC